MLSPAHLAILGLALHIGGLHKQLPRSMAVAGVTLGLIATLWLVLDTAHTLEVSPWLYLGSSVVGNVMLLRTGLLLASLAALRYNHIGAQSLSFAVALTLGMVSHSNTFGFMGVLLHGMHSYAAAAWTGLLVASCWHWRLLPQAWLSYVSKYSLLWCGLAVASGLILGLLHVGIGPQLNQSPYGQLLVVKLVILGVVLAFAAYHRIRLKHVGVSTLWLEGVLLVVVLGLGASLRQTPPPSKEVVQPIRATLEHYDIVGKLWLEPPVVHLQFDAESKNGTTNTPVLVRFYPHKGGPPVVREYFPYLGSSYHMTVPLSSGKWNMKLSLQGDTLEGSLVMP